MFEDSAPFVDAFNRWFGEDRAAVNYALMMVEVAHFWDDLVDGEPVSEERTNRVMRMLVFDIPRNPFFMQHSMDLTGLHLDIFLAWRDATVMERGWLSDDDLAKCYQLRAGLYSLFARMAWLLGGDDWSDKIGPEIRRAYGETFEEYVAEMREATTAKED